MMICLGYAYECACVFVCVLSVCNLLMMSAHLEQRIEHDKLHKNKLNITRVGVKKLRIANFSKVKLGLVTGGSSRP